MSQTNTSRRVWINERGYRIGESHHAIKHSDDLVEQVRCLRDAGKTYDQIACELGIARRTVRDWIKCRRRAQFYVAWKTAAGKS